MQGHGCARVGAARVLQPHPSACTYHSAAAGAAIAPAARTPAPADTRQHHPSPARVCTAPSTASNVCCPRRSARPSSAAEKAPTRSSGRPWPMRSHAPIMRSTPRHPIKPATTRARTTHARRAPSLRRPQIPRRHLKGTSPACAACARSDRCCPTRRQQLARRRPAPARRPPRIAAAAAAVPPHAAPSCSGPTARLSCLPRSSAAGAREQRGTVLAPNSARCDGLDALVKRS